MPLIFILSALFFLFLLIRLSLAKDSKKRFLIKSVACIHFVLLGIWAVSNTQVSLTELFILLGLIVSFIGDIVLGLKYRFKIALPLGILFFAGAQIFYILHFGVNELTLYLMIPFGMLMFLFSYHAYHSNQYDFNGLNIPVAVYACLMTLTLVASGTHYRELPSISSQLSMFGVILFFISDFTLVHVYFYQKKSKALIVLHLTCYHIGQLLIALSLWY